MKDYNIPILWQSYMRINVKANNLEEAVKLALREFLSQPDEHYLEDSFEIDSILDEEYPDETFDIHKIYFEL